MKINIETIPQNQHRYDTCGDYWYDEAGVLQVRVTDMGNEIYEKMVIIHELCEEAMTKHLGITEQQISDFDLAYEAKREEGDLSEPGFDKNAPYLREHTISTAVEMLMCAHLGISWNDYDEFFAKDIRISVLKRIFSKYIKKIASEILKLDYVETPQKYCHVSERSFKDLGEKLSQKEWKEHFEEMA